MINVLLPWPPSVNTIWRRGPGRTYRNPKYVAWIEEAGWAIKALRIKKIEGPFRAEITLVPPNLRSDLDNFQKPILDLAQKMGLIENDKFCQKLTVAYGDSKTQPVGVRLRLWPFSGNLRRPGVRGDGGLESS